MDKFLCGLLIGVILTVALIVIGAFSLARFGTEKRVVVPDSSTLILRLEGDIPERPPIELPIPFFEQQTSSSASPASRWSLISKDRVPGSTIWPPLATAYTWGPKSIST